MNKLGSDSASAQARDVFAGARVVEEHLCPPDEIVVRADGRERAAPREAPPTKPASVSVVIASMGRRAVLHETVKSILAQSSNPREIILALPSLEHVDPRTMVLPSVRVILSPPGSCRQRNEGIAAVGQGSDYIAFFDDDELADPQWLRQLLEMAQEKQARCVGGAVYLLLPEGIQRNLSPVSRMLLGETVGMDTPRKFDHRTTPTCGNLLIHRSVFDEIGLFDPAYNRRGEDTDLFLRIYHAKIEAWFTPAAFTQHVTPPNRLTDEYLQKMSETMIRGMAEQERNACGRWAYPVIWLARVGQAALVLFPRWLSAKVAGDHDRVLGAACRLKIAGGYLRDGWNLICGMPPKYAA